MDCIAARGTNREQANEPWRGVGEQVDELGNEVFVIGRFKDAVRYEDVAPKALEDGEGEEDDAYDNRGCHHLLPAEGFAGFVGKAPHGKGG